MFSQFMFSFMFHYLIFAVPVKKFDYYAEYYEGEDAAANLPDQTFQMTEKPFEKVGKSQKSQTFPSLNIFESKPTEIAFNFLNSIFNIGQKILKPLGIDGRAQIIKQEDRNGNKHMEFHKEIDLFGLHGKDVDKVILTNGSPTYLTSKRIDFFGTQLGGIDSNKQVLLNPSQAGYVNCNQYRLLGGIVNDCDRRSFDLSAVPKFLQSTGQAMNIFGNLKKPFLK